MSLDVSLYFCLFQWKCVQEMMKIVIAVTVCSCCGLFILNGLTESRNVLKVEQSEITPPVFGGSVFFVYFPPWKGETLSCESALLGYI